MESVCDLTPGLGPFRSFHRICQARLALSAHRVASENITPVQPAIEMAIVASLQAPGLIPRDHGAGNLARVIVERAELRSLLGSLGKRRTADQRGEKESAKRHDIEFLFRHGRLFPTPGVVDPPLPAFAGVTKKRGSDEKRYQNFLFGTNAASMCAMRSHWARMCMSDWCMSSTTP